MLSKHLTCTGLARDLHPLLQQFGDGAEDLHLDPQLPAPIPVSSLQHLLNPNTRSVDILSWFEEKDTAQVNKKMSQRAIETQLWEGEPAAKQNLSSTQTASPSPGHMAANQVHQVFLVWHTMFSRKSLLTFPQPIPSLPDVCFFRTHLIRCKKKGTILWEHTDSEGWASAGSGRAVSCKRHSSLFLSQDIQDILQDEHFSSKV